MGFTTLIGVELMIRRKWYAFVFSIANQFVWLAYILVAKQYGLLPLNLILFIQNTRGLIAWRRAHRKSIRMLNIVCPTKLLHPAAKAPARGTDFAAGHDICCVGGLQGLDTVASAAVCTPENMAAWNELGDKGYVTLQPGMGSLFRTGFAQAIHPDYACFLWDRSGMGAMKQVGRLAGVIDPDYRGEWFVRLVNHSNNIVHIQAGDRIVQGVYQERVVATCPIVDDLPSTDRGSGGFGSTDKS